MTTTSLKVSGKHLGNRLCDVLGISKLLVREIAISADAQEAAYVIIKRFITEDEAGKIEAVISRYSMCENESIGGSDDDSAED